MIARLKETRGHDLAGISLAHPDPARPPGLSHAVKWWVDLTCLPCVPQPGTSSVMPRPPPFVAAALLVLFSCFLFMFLVRAYEIHWMRSLPWCCAATRYPGGSRDDDAVRDAQPHHRRVSQATA